MPVNAAAQTSVVAPIQRPGVEPAVLEKQVKVAWATLKGKQKFVPLSKKIGNQLRDGKFHQFRLSTRLMADAPTYSALVPKNDPSQFIVLRSGGFGMMPAVMSKKAIDIVSGPVVELKAGKNKVTTEERATLSLLLPSDPVRPTEKGEWKAVSNSRILGAPNHAGTLSTERIGVSGNEIFQTKAMGITELGKPAKITFSRSQPDGRKETITVEVTVRPIRMY